ncbi:efflux RND transporter periplasmic adaptor subunit [Methylomonas sp. SURF-2]|uniref:Efflux RND transporter periplasmic adaptor subunit n=1 Tax=Methylomonas subterranea TaxID=2952225 RepID=A0ABT1TD22_9GAMM|nr:efflux RND transporter periplasmic adaptor subunit [Methylomonas sp. SURF-2]MCQ8103357.1 efflux RND transporter periplasmic adaptor subunit [Methylomonas sp. SURF-2]
MTEHFGMNKPNWLIPAAAITALLLVILFALGILGGASKTPPGNTPPNAASLPAGAQTLQVAKQAADNVLSWQGIVQSRLSAKIAPKLNARIVEIAVRPGDSVKKGDIIARLDDRDLRAAYQAASAAHVAAQAQAGQASADEKRMLGLYEKQAATTQAYEAALAQAKAARATAAQAASAANQSKVMLGENVLYAPFDGIIGERLQEPGDMGLPNQPIVTLHKPDDLRLEAAIASQCAAAIKLGMTVGVRLEAPRQILTATVDEIAPEIDPQTRTQGVKVKLPKVEGVRQGQFGWLELACLAEQQALLIPVTAIVQYGQLQAVKVLEGQGLTTRHIRAGKQYGSRIEVLSGLREGETILISGAASLPGDGGQLP